MSNRAIGVFLAWLTGLSMYAAIRFFWAGETGAGLVWTGVSVLFGGVGFWYFERGSK